MASKNKFIPSFRIYDENKRKIPSLINCFLKETRISKDDYLNLRGLSIKTADGVKSYVHIWDDSIHLPIAELGKGQYLSVVISFQEHTHGNYAVIKKAEY